VKNHTWALKGRGGGSRCQREKRVEWKGRTTRGEGFKPGTRKGNRWGREGLFVISILHEQVVGLSKFPQV